MSRFSSSLAFYDTESTFVRKSGQSGGYKMVRKIVNEGIWNCVTIRSGHCGTTLT